MEQISTVHEFTDDNKVEDRRQPEFTQEQLDEMIRRVAEERIKAGDSNTIKTVISDGTEWKQDELLKRVKELCEKQNINMTDYAKPSCIDDSYMPQLNKENNQLLEVK